MFQISLQKTVNAFQYINRADTMVGTVINFMADLRGKIVLFSVYDLGFIKIFSQIITDR